MMKTNLLLAAILLCLLPSVADAQLTILRDNGTGIPITANPYREVKGSAYLEDFTKGKIFLPDGQWVEGLQIALNAYENTLEYKLEGSLFSYTSDKLSGFTYTSATSGPVEFTSAYELPTLKDKRFVRVLEKGNYILLLHTYKIMIDDPSATYGTQAAKVFQSQQELFVVSGGKVHLMKGKEKDLNEIFGQDAAKAGEWIKSQKLNVKDMDDMRALIRQLNQ
jgi:hypothetical protein